MSDIIGFNEYYDFVNQLEYIYNRNDTIEDFLEDVSSSGMGVSAVTTSDIAINVLPLGLLRRKNPINYNELKRNKKAMEFIDENIDKYRSLYKKNADMVIRSVAEHLFLKKK